MILVIVTLCSFTKLRWINVNFQSYHDFGNSYTLQLHKFTMAQHNFSISLFIQTCTKGRIDDQTYKLLLTLYPNIQMLTMKLNNITPTSKHKLIT